MAHNGRHFTSLETQIDELAHEVLVRLSKTGLGHGFC